MAATWTAREQTSTGNRRTLMISLLFGLVSAFMIYRLLASTQSSGGGTATVPVLVAAQDIPAKTVVTAAMVTLRQVTPNLRLATSYVDSKAAVGHVARNPISAGEQILTAKLADSVKDVGFSGQVPQGMRGVAIPVVEVMAGGGLLQPGDYVDVIGVFGRTDSAPDSSSFLSKSDKPVRMTAVTILQDVQLLAVAQTVTDPLAQPNSKGGAKPNPDAKSITLAVTPEDAQKLFLVDQVGTLRLSLHHFGDHDTQPLPSIDNNVPDIYGQTTSGKPAAVAGPTAPQATPQPGSPTR